MAIARAALLSRDVAGHEYALGATAYVTFQAIGLRQNAFHATGLKDHTVLDDSYAFLPTRGGLVSLSEGAYNISPLANWTKPVWLLGPGPEICVINTTVGSGGIAISVNSGGSNIEFGGGVQGVTLRDTQGGSDRKGIYVYETQHFVIRGCWIDDYGTNIHYTGQSFMGLVEGNQIKRVKGATGILVDSDVTSMYIIGNRIIMANGATRLIDFNGDDSWIMANFLEQANNATNTDCIRLNSAAARNAITLNTFDMNGVVTNCILVVAGATNNRIEDNRNLVYPTAATAISDSGTATVVRFNDGYITENKGASSGTGAQQTVAHGLSFTPTRQQIALIAGSATANPYHSAAPDATNIYVTAANGQAWYWATVG